MLIQFCKNKAGCAGTPPFKAAPDQEGIVFASLGSPAKDPFHFVSLGIRPVGQGGRNLRERHSLERMGKPLTIYLANMYGLLNQNTNAEVSELRGLVLSHVEERKNAAEVEDKAGNLSDTD